MKLTHNGRRYELLGSKFDCERAGLKAGFSKSTKGVWYTGKPQLALQLAPHSDDAARAKLIPFIYQIADSRQLVSTFPVPKPDNNMAFLPFQHASVAYTSQQPNNLNADEMGLGKTLSAIGHVNYFNSIKSVLCCVPSTAKINWRREWNKWKSRNMSVEISDGKLLPKSDVVIFNYEAALKLAEQIDERHWDLVIFDEAHYMKNGDTKRTQCLLGRDEKREYVPGIRAEQYMFLTGTPVENRPRDLWSIIRFMDRDGLGSNKNWFETRYCAARMGHFGWENNGASHLSELNDYLRGTFMLRRLRREVFPQMPVKRRQILVVPPGTAKRSVEEELDFYEQSKADIDRARAEADRLQSGGNKETYKAAVKRLHDIQGVTFENMAALRRASAVAMVPHAVSLIQDILEDGEKLIVFAYHVEVVEKLADHFGPLAVRVLGKMNDVEKQDAVDAFQEKDNVRLIVGTIPAMYAVYTLTAAHVVLFVELDWRATRIKQAEDRADRIGQTEQVLCLHLVFDGSLGARMANRIVSKLEVEEECLD